MKGFLTIAALLLSATALAHPGHDDKVPFDKLDADSDGMISRAEADSNAPRIGKEFDTIDTDKDGQLTRDEVKAFAAERMKQMREHVTKAFSDADGDGDGRLSKAEAEKGMPLLARRFERIDADGDGYLTKEEMQERMGSRHREHDQHGDEDRSRT